MAEVVEGQGVNERKLNRKTEDGSDQNLGSKLTNINS